MLTTRSIQGNGDVRGSAACATVHCAPAGVVRLSGLHIEELNGTTKVMKTLRWTPPALAATMA
jgi:hypothetical protein